MRPVVFGAVALICVGFEICLVMVLRLTEVHRQVMVMVWTPTQRCAHLISAKR